MVNQLPILNSQRDGWFAWYGSTHILTRANRKSSQSMASRRGLASLKLTAISHQKIGRDPEWSTSLPTINFQVQTVSFREGNTPKSVKWIFSKASHFQGTNLFFRHRLSRLPHDLLICQETPAAPRQRHRDESNRSNLSDIWHRRWRLGAPSPGLPNLGSIHPRSLPASSSWGIYHPAYPTFSWAFWNICLGAVSP